VVESYSNLETGAEATLPTLLADGLYYTLIEEPGSEDAYQVTVDYMEHQVPAGAVDLPERL
jgi:hypothetical protein